MLPTKRFLLLLFLFIAIFTYSQQEPNGLVKWLSFKEAQAKNKVVERPFLVDLYTDWCGWCKHMMRTTYSNPGIAEYINTHFYPVKFDAETKDTVEYDGKIYKPLSKEPKTPHELAIKFLGNSLSYPSTVFVTNNYQYNLLSQGYLEDKKIEPLLVFMVENAWRSAPFDEFNKHFLNAFYDTAFPKTTVKKQNIHELEALQKKKAKKVLVLLTSPFCNTGRVMAQTSFVDTSVAAYINKHFYYVELDASSGDTIRFKKEKYSQVMLNNFPIHNLAMKLSLNRFSLPTLCILDEELNTIEVLNFYQSPERLKPVLPYFGSNAYKTKTFAEYMAEKTKAAATKKTK